MNIKDIKVFFFTSTCYRCGETVGLYSVEEITTDDNQVLESKPSFISEEESLMFNEQIVRLIRLYLEDHPEIGINIGQIKKEV